MSFLHKTKLVKLSFLCAASTFLYVATRADGMDVPQGLHEGSVHLDVAVGDGQVLQGRRTDLIKHFIIRVHLRQ